MGLRIQRRGNATSQTRTTVPPASTFAATGATTWIAANTALFSRFTLEQRTTRRYVNFNVGVSSGNIQVGIVSLAAAGLSFTRVVDSGVIACPAAGDVRVDLGEFTLDPGDYAVFIWANNTTVTIPRTGNAAMSSSRLIFSLGSLASGVEASGTVALTGNALLGVTLSGS